MYDVFTPETQSLTKRVYNTGTSTAFVRVEVLEIDVTPKMNQRESTQKEVDAGSLTQNDSLSHTRLSFSSGFQTVRICGQEREIRTLFRSFTLYSQKKMMFV
ncbi:hypothetical protein PROSTU_00700 [Providencia stuartii ATCC 25827]|uniref:Uncharacterized protein n=2 Tax=Providencia stuartii TaxID=588 RepID=A0AA87CSI6_PROST|nr:hypothetical protein PROSTU_00700 [Providencia stuartii ATCC 25827]